MIVRDYNAENPSCGATGPQVPDLTRRILAVFARVRIVLRTFRVNPANPFE